MFQENLKTYRKAKGLTQEDLAVRLHVVRQTISKWEKGVSLDSLKVMTGRFLFREKSKKLILSINTGVLSNMNENIKEIYH